MFAYCGNNPVKCADPTGQWWLVDWIEEAAEDVGVFLLNGYCDFATSVDDDFAAFYDFFGCDDLADTLRYGANDWQKWKKHSLPDVDIEGMHLYYPYSESNYRANFAAYTQCAGAGLVAHHVLPQEFEEKFDNAKLEIHSPIFLTWLTPQRHTAIHSAGYNGLWKSFFDSNPNASQEDILDFADELAETFGFKVYYNG